MKKTFKFFVLASLVILLLSVTFTVSAYYNDHEHIYDSYVVPPTCTEEGYTYYFCTVTSYCLEDYISDFTEPTGHTYSSDWQVEISPSCTEKGVKFRTCDNCWYWDYADIEPTGHDTKNAYWYYEQFPSCTNGGLEVLACPLCLCAIESRVIQPSGHDYIEDYICDPTCTEWGYIVYRCGNWDCMESYRVKYGEPRGHSFDEWQIVEYADCRNTGLKRRDCWSCYDYYEEEVIPTTGHLWDEWNVTFNPECENEGIKIRMCLYCTEEEVGSVPATGHCFGDWMPWDYDEFGEVTLEMRMCDVCMKDEYRTPPATFTFIGTNKVGDNTKVYVNVKNTRNGDCVWFATYGDDGRFLGIHFAEVKNNYASVEIEDDDVANVKALLWNDGIKPVCNHASTDI